jgi:ketosteroid isomerase-like protein
MEGGTAMRTLLKRAALGVVLVSLAACGRSSGNSAAEEAIQQQADYWAIFQITQNFHEATSKKDIDLMMSLYAPQATLTIPGQTAVGTEQIRQFWLTKSEAFKPTNNWLSETPAYKIEITAAGDQGTLHFECHYVDVDGKSVVVHLTSDQEVARLDGTWLITDMVVGEALLRP